MILCRKLAFSKDTSNDKILNDKKLIAGFFSIREGLEN
jgi:hypothetical protein